MLASAVVPVRGRPLMSTGPRTGRSSISGWSAYHASTSSRFTEATAQVADDVGVGRRGQVGVALEAVEQHVEPVAEVAGTEVVEPGRSRRLGEQRVDVGTALVRSRCSRRLPHAVGVEVLGDAAEAVAPADRARAGDRRCASCGRRPTHATRPGSRLTTTSGSTPSSSPKYADVLLHAHRLVAAPVHDGRGHASPRRAAARAARRCRRRGSGCTVIGSQRVCTGSPAAIASRCQTGSPPWSLYAAPMRAMVDGQVERAGAVARHRLLGDLRDRVRRRRRRTSRRRAGRPRGTRATGRGAACRR